jgi:hypothetical protein
MEKGGDSSLLRGCGDTQQPESVQDAPCGFICCNLGSILWKKSHVCFWWLAFWAPFSGDRPSSFLFPSPNFLLKTSYPTEALSRWAHFELTLNPH